MSTRWFGVAILLLTGITALFVGIFFVSAHAPLHGAVMNPPYAAPEIQLTDQNQQPFQLSAQSGQAVLIYFGYTQCPDECPRAMATYKQVRAALGQQAGKVRFVFITVDPAHDDAAALRTFLGKFDPAITGLTGTPDQLSQVWQSYGIYQEAASGRVSHTDQIFLIDPRGKVRTLYDNTAAALDILADVRQVLRGG